MLAKMPVQMGQVMVAPCFLASVLRISFMVVSLPLGTLCMSSSTSVGLGMTTVPVAPQCLLILGVMGSMRGKSLLSRSFSDQLFLLLGK